MTADQLLLVRPEPRRLCGFRIPGDPVRAKHACTCAGGHGRTFPLETWRNWRDAVVPLLRARWRGRRPISLPVRAEVVAVFQRPAKARETALVKGVAIDYPEWTEGRVPFIGRPDWDQIFKAGTDVLVHAGVLLDDMLILGPHGGGRWYAAEGEGPSVQVSLWSDAGSGRLLP